MGHGLKIGSVALSLLFDSLMEVVMPRYSMGTIGTCKGYRGDTDFTH